MGRRRSHRTRGLILGLGMGLGACAAPASMEAPPGNPTGAATPEQAPPPADTGAAAPEERTLDVGRFRGGGGSGAQCALPQPVKSEDACSNDAECAPATPCHARACVAVAKSQPRSPDTVCTQNLECDTADVNRCGCYEGRCALIPPSGR